MGDKVEIVIGGENSGALRALAGVEEGLAVGALNLGQRHGSNQDFRHIKCSINYG